MSKDPLLDRAIAEVLARLEADEEILICTASPQRVVKHLSEAVLDTTPNTGLTHAELSGLKALIVHYVTADAGAFSWSELQTLTGFSPEGFQAIADKLPRG